MWDFQTDGGKCMAPSLLQAVAYAEEYKPTELANGVGASFHIWQMQILPHLLCFTLCPCGRICIRHTQIKAGYFSQHILPP